MTAPNRENVRALCNKNKKTWFSRAEIRRRFHGDMIDGARIGAILNQMYERGELEREKQDHVLRNRTQRVWYYRKKEPLTTM